MHALIITSKGLRLGEVPVSYDQEAHGLNPCVPSTFYARMSMLSDELCMMVSQSLVSRRDELVSPLAGVILYVSLDAEAGLDGCSGGNNSGGDSGGSARRSRGRRR